VKTYGTCTYNKRARSWDFVVEPHVAIRVKRWFAKIDTWQYGVLSLAATPENCRDLEVFLMRYPLLVTPRDLLDERANEHKERQSLVESLLDGLTPPKSYALKLPPRQYQAVATHMWLTTGGLLCADDVGLGKTAIAIAGFTDPRTLPALVVTLTHLPAQWKDEIHKFTDLKVHILRKGQPYDITKFTDGKFPDVIISNYHKLAGWSETIAPLVKSVVFDEGHELRHTESQKYRAAKHIADAVDFRLSLSATPIFNLGGEIYNIIDVTSPGALGTKEEFHREWCKFKYNKISIKDPAAFGLYAREMGLMLRRTRKEVKRELPDVIVVPHHIDADLEIVDAMKDRAIELAKIIVRQVQDFKGQKMQAAGEFDLKLRHFTGVAKAPFVAEFVKFLIEESGEPVVLYGWHRDVYDIWLKELAEFNPVMYTGTESPIQKEASKQAFVTGQSKVIIISLRAGAGLNGLQDVCHTCVFGELDWSPSTHEQAIGRLNRDGQDEPVLAYYMLSDEGSDPIMSDILGVKKQQLEGLRDPNQDLVTKLQIEEDYIKRLAEKYLFDHGVSVPPPLAQNKVENINEDVL
jgi:SNF2 family DNA or RNA helicase